MNYLYFKIFTLYTDTSSINKPSKSSEIFSLTSTSGLWRTELWPVKVAHSIPYWLLSAWKSQFLLCLFLLGLPGIHQTVREQTYRLPSHTSNAEIHSRVFQEIYHFWLEWFKQSSSEWIFFCFMLSVVPWWQNSPLPAANASAVHTIHVENIWKIKSHLGFFLDKVMWIQIRLEAWKQDFLFFFF